MCAIEGSPSIYLHFITFEFFVRYNLSKMKYKVSEFAKKFRSIVGDSTNDVPDSFIIDALNWAFSELPLAPKMDKIFTKHYRVTLKPGHYRWNLVNHKDFRRLTDIPASSFWTSEGGNLCPLCVCAVSIEDLYTNTVPNLMQSGKPCSYAIEQEDDDIFIVFDRPTDKPIIIQYIAYGIPKPVETMDDIVEISGVIENALLEVMRVVWYREADDLSFAGSAYDYLDNKYIPQMTQMIHKSWKGIEGNVILGV